MGLPVEKAAGYHDGSPIDYADSLNGKLLIIHGTGDDNVHFQGRQRLMNDWWNRASHSTSWSIRTARTPSPKARARPCMSTR